MCTRRATCPAQFRLAAPADDLAARRGEVDLTHALREETTADRPGSTRPSHARLHPSAPASSYQSGLRLNSGESARHAFHCTYQAGRRFISLLTPPQREADGHDVRAREGGAGRSRGTRLYAITGPRHPAVEVDLRASGDPGRTRGRRHRGPGGEPATVRSRRPGHRRGAPVRPGSGRRDLDRHPTSFVGRLPTSYRRSP